MKYGCIGEKLGHSFSREVHALIGDYEYVLHEVKREELDAFMTQRDFCAINVTIPYKQDVIPYLDWISPEAGQIGAVNTIVNRQGRLYGYNTDFGGMKALLDRMGADVRGKKALILGSGGTCRTARSVLHALGAGNVISVSRTGRDGAVTYEEMYARHTDAAFIINTTPVGMYPGVDGTPAELKKFTRLEGVLDAVYNPLRTCLVQDAREMGIPVEGGLYMLVMQAVLAAEIFFDEKIDQARADSIYKTILRSKENMVLIGMPGSGKSSVGRFLASRLERELVDTDKVVVEEQNCPIADIFQQDGEQAFRDMETDVVKRVSMTGGKVISTGGGAVLRRENVRYLRMNGQLFFLDRDIALIKPTASRPLSSTREDLEKRYQERYPLYTSVCDFHVKTTPMQEMTAALIEGMFMA